MNELMSVRRWKQQIWWVAVAVLVIGLPAGVSAQMAEDEASAKRESSLSQVSEGEQAGVGPLAGPSLERGPAAPGVPMSFGRARYRGGGVSYRANLRLYRRVLEQLDLNAEKVEEITALYQSHNAATSAYYKAHAEESKRLRAIVQAAKGDKGDRDVKREDVVELSAEVLVAEQRLREINGQKPSAEPVMVSIWEALDDDEQARFQAKIDELRGAVDGAGAQGRAMGMGGQNDKRKTMLERRVDFIDELLGIDEDEDTSELTVEDRRVLERARERLLAAMKAQSDGVAQESGGRRRNRVRRLPPQPPLAREIVIEEDEKDEGDGG